MIDLSRRGFLVAVGAYWPVKCINTLLPAQVEGRYIDHSITPHCMRIIGVPEADSVYINTWSAHGQWQKIKLY